MDDQRATPDTQAVIESLRVWMKSLRDSPDAVSTIEAETHAWRMNHRLSPTLHPTKGPALSCVRHDDVIFVGLPDGFDVRLGQNVHRILPIRIEGIVNLN